MKLERRLQGDLRESVDFLLSRNYCVAREGDQLILIRGQRRVLVDGRLAVIGRGGVR
ncbi:hypothetical protein N5D83_02630 [Pseudomonas chengduensis]|nr:hypothetical protein [Pseudomonas chengduensis]MDH1865713.1 hypothetical protein [Pseudomonas chengduensis]